MQKFIKNYMFHVALVAGLLLALTATAFAQDESLVDLAAPIYEAVLSGNYAFAAALGVVFLVAVTRRYGGTYFPILSHELVAPLLVLAASGAGAVAAATSSGAAFSTAIAWGALKVAVYAGGGYSLAKPYLEALAKKAPVWAKPFIGIVSLIFASKSGAKLAAAKKAGKAAVAANPAKGDETDFVDYP